MSIEKERNSNYNRKRYEKMAVMQKKKRFCCCAEDDKKMINSIGII
jgi:hypothetical protein